MEITAGSGDEGRAFLQRRVALFWKVALGLGLFGTTVQAIAMPEGIASTAFVLMAATVAIAAVVWAIARGGARSLRSLRVIEIVGLALLIFVIATMSRHFAADLMGDDAYRPLEGRAGEYYGNGVALMQQTLSSTTIIGLALVFVARAAVIPSRPGYMILTTALLGVPYVLVSAFGSIPSDAETMLRAGIDTRGSIVILLNSITWWVMLTGICGVVSAVVHGLQREVTAARQLGQYTLEAKLGEGGMGIVYRAQHAMMRRRTAIKLLLPSHTAGTDLARFEREVQLTARLTHPNTITIFDYGRTPDGLFYYAMELLDGATLDKIVAGTGPFSAARTIHVLLGVCGALEEAHGVGLIHRDVKPQNIMLCRQGGLPDVPKLLDFGLVKEVRTDTDSALTKAESVTGTPLFMAPEALTEPDRIDPRSDIYAIGAVAYYLVTAEHVFAGRTVVEVCGHHLHTEPDPPSERTDAPVPDDLEALILDCLNKDPDDRPQSAHELIERLEACGDADGWSRDDAEAFWSEHPALVTASSTESGSSVGTRTLAIDLKRETPRPSTRPPR